MAATRGAGGANVERPSGTVQYMSPEQLNGDAGDQRADIFAFGCVLYEMLAGRKAFEGTTALMVLAAIMRSEPPPIERIAAAHPLLDHVLRRCLEKDRERRWQSIRDAAGELRWIADQPGRGARVAAAAGAPPACRVVARSRCRPLSCWPVRPRSGWAARTRTGARRAAGDAFEIATRADGRFVRRRVPRRRRVAFVADRDGDPMLWVRPLDEVESRVLPGTTGATQPFWSPDGRTVGVLRRGQAEANRPGRRSAGGRRRRAECPRRDVGPRRHDPVRARRLRVRSSAWRRAAAPTEPVTRTGAEHRAEPSLAAVPARRPPLPVLLGARSRRRPTACTSPRSTRRRRCASCRTTVAAASCARSAADAAPGRAPGVSVRRACRPRHRRADVVGAGLPPAAAGRLLRVGHRRAGVSRSAAAQLRQLVWVDRQGRVVDTVGEPDSDGSRRRS